jgi:transposase
MVLVVEVLVVMLNKQCLLSKELSTLLLLVLVVQVRQLLKGVVEIQIKVTTLVLEISLLKVAEVVVLEDMLRMVFQAKILK